MVVYFAGGRKAIRGSSFITEFHITRRSTGSLTLPVNFLLGLNKIGDKVLESPPEEHYEDILKKIQDNIQGALENKKASDRERRRRCRENRRRLTVTWIGGILTFVVVNGSTVILLNKTGIAELLNDEWRLGHTLSALVIGALWIGFALLLYSAFFWLSEKTGLHYIIEDWVISWDTRDILQSSNIQKYREFSRKKRKGLIADTKKELDVITNQLYHLELEADNTDDEKLSDSVENLNEVIGNLVTEVYFSCRSRSLPQDRASWKGFVLALEETSNELDLKLKDIAKYHEKIQPLLKHASNITSKVLDRIIVSGKDKKGPALGI
ncbi:MAG: hypothetical protein FNP40_04190 [Dehalobacter sp. 4CP]|nr:hypothetical protein [Dehalobacter sp. 4CP]